MEFNSEDKKGDTRRWYDYIPHSVAILFIIIIVVSLMSYFVPSGTYDRIDVDGSLRVIPGSYKKIDSPALGIMDVFRSIPLGFKFAVEIIFVVFAGGIMFGLLEKTKTLENLIGSIIRTLGTERKVLIVVIASFIYGFMGVAVGYENNIALVPIAAMLSLAIGGDLILAAGISVGAMTVGFGLSPINPYTVGTGHKIAQLALFSGWELRSLLCLGGLVLMAWYNVRYFKKILNNPTKGLSKGLDTQGLLLTKSLEKYKMTSNNWLCLFIFTAGMVAAIHGIFTKGWMFNELSAIFLMIGLACGISARLGSKTISETVLSSVALVAPGAFMVGYASSIRVLMETAMIADTISYELSLFLSQLPVYASAICMCLSQCIINLFIPSGSGQALATLPVMIPLGELLGLSPQCSILAFQIGDGVTNLFNPSLGGLIAMLSMCRVPLDRWLRFIFPLALLVLAFALCGLIFAVLTGYN